MNQQYIQALLLANSWIVYITTVFYFYDSLCRYITGRKIGTSDNWWAFFPILRFFHLFRMAGKSWRWPFLICTIIALFLSLYLYPSYQFIKDLFPALFFPFLCTFTCVISFLYIYAEIARARGKSTLWAILWIIPPLNPLVWGYLAFSSVDAPRDNDNSSDRDSKIITVLMTLIMSTFLIAYEFGPLEIREKISSYWNQTLSFCKTMLTYPSKDKKDKWKLQDEWMLKEDVFYSYKDSKGTEHFVSSREDVPEQYRDQRESPILSTDLGGQFKIMTKEEEGGMLNKLQGAPLPEHLKNTQHEIFIYTFDKDPHLADTKAYFSEFHLPYKILDVLKNMEYASQLKMKLGLDQNLKYNDLLFPILEIDGQMIERVVDQIDSKGRVIEHSLNKPKINKIFGLRATYEE